MQSTRNPLSILFVLAASVAQQKPVNADSPRYLFGTATPMTELKMPGSVNTAISLTPDGLEAFFARATFNSATDLRTSSEIYMARRASTSEPFGTPQRITELLPPATYGDAAPSISADGLTLYFGRALNADSEPSEELRWPMNTIHSATRPSRDAPFDTPREVTNLKANDDPGGIGRPEISADGLSLYMQYVHLNPRDSDVYISQRASVNDPWGLAKPIAEFSTSDPAHYLWESAPGLTADGQGLFLELTWYGGSSQDLPDMHGDVDLYFAQRDGQGAWSKPVNLGDVINTAGHYQTDPFLTANGSTFYFNRAVYSNGPQNTTWELYQAPVLPFSAEPLKGNGSSYSQTFEALGTDASRAFSPLPPGWTFTANDVVFDNVTTRRFPNTGRPYAGVYNAGTDGAEDRTLVTDVTRNEAGELDFRALVTDDALRALRLGFDVEAWQVRNGVGADPGEAAFHVVLEADSGSGFQQVADLGEFSTGKTLSRPTSGNLVDGNDPAYRRSFDTGPVDMGLIPAGATLRTRWIGTAGSRNVVFGLDNVSLRFAAPGDANIDGVFNSRDLIGVLQAGQYEDNITRNSTWAEGDWDGNGDFDKEDIVLALQNGGYLHGPYAAVQPGGTIGDGQTSVIYNVGTGELSVDAPAGIELTSINIDSSAGIFTGQAAANLGGSFDNDTDGNIFKATFGGSFGSLTFGNVAQTRLTEEFVLGDLTVIGSLAGGGDLGNVNLVYVPEPASVLLLSVGLLSGLLHFGRSKW